MSNEPILAWHFVGATLRDGNPIPPDGEWLHHRGKCVMCQRGLHASRRIIDALQYAPGSTICRVACSVIVEEKSDKLVCGSRFILWRLAADDTLRTFARKAALSVIHLWNAPDVVRQYLETGDESLRDAACDAARDAAWAAASDAARDAASDDARDAARAAACAAARDAAWDAAWAAACAAARDAAWAAASDAARDAAWAAASDAAWAAAWGAACDAARDAASDDARDAARAAARAAAWADLNNQLEAMVLEARGNPDDQALLKKVPRI